MSGERGYALWVAVLVVALLSLATLTLAQIYDVTRPRVELARAQARAAIAAESASARVAFLLLSEPIGPRSVVLGAPREAGMASADGRAELRLDGRLYSFGERTWVGVQDERGLISVNSADEHSIARLLVSEGVGSSRARQLAAALADYVDADELVRVGGVERRAGADIAARDGPLPTRWAVLDVLGWRATLADQGLRRRMLNLLAAGGGEGSVNLNTAPRGVLNGLLGPRKGGEVAVRREQREIRDAAELQSLTNVGGGGAEFATMPGDAFRVTVLVGDAMGGSQFFERRLLLTPEGETPVVWEEERRGSGDAGYSETHEQPVEPYPEARARSAR